MVFRLDCRGMVVDCMIRWVRVRPFRHPLLPPLSEIFGCHGWLGRTWEQQLLLRLCEGMFRISDETRIFKAKNVNIEQQRPIGLEKALSYQITSSTSVCTCRDGGIALRSRVGLLLRTPPSFSDKVSWQNSKRGQWTTSSTPSFFDDAPNLQRRGMRNGQDG
jgi:hypothetical protein